MNNWSWLNFDTPALFLDKGESLFQQGATIERMFVLVRGRVRLLRHTVEGNAVVLHSGRAGEMIAEASLFSDTYHCSAIVDQHAEFHTLERNAALAQILDSPGNSRRVLKLLSHQVRNLRGLIEVRNIRSAQSRILAYLSNMAGSDGRVILNASLRDIAYKLGLAHETLYRELSLLEKNGQITRPEPGIIKIQQ